MQDGDTLALLKAIVMQSPTGCGSWLWSFNKLDNDLKISCHLSTGEEHPYGGCLSSERGLRRVLGS